MVLMGVNRFNDTSPFFSLMVKNGNPVFAAKAKPRQSGCSV